MGPALWLPGNKDWEDGAAGYQLGFRSVHSVVVVVADLDKKKKIQISWEPALQQDFPGFWKSNSQ